MCIHIEWLFCDVRFLRNCPTVFVGRRLNGLMFHFLKSGRRSLLLEARFIAWNLPNTAFISCRLQVVLY